MHNASTSNMFDEFAEDLLGERTARPLIIIGASKVDNLLFQILNVYLLPKRATEKDQDELLEGDKPLGIAVADFGVGVLHDVAYLSVLR